jgi:hypothetical protein
MAVLVWLGTVGRSLYEVVLTRTLRADSTWALLDGAVVVVATIMILLLTIFLRTRAWTYIWFRAGPAMLALGAMTVALVVWAANATLPEQRAVPMPPVSATPQVVVRAYVAALNEHDLATAEALSSRLWQSQSGYLDDNMYVRVRITWLSESAEPVTGDAGLPPGVKSVLVGVGLVGWPRFSGPNENGDWGYYLAPVGPHHAWRIIDEGCPC